MIPEWFLSIDDHRYGGGGAVRRAPYNKGTQGRGPSFGGRDVRGYQSHQGHSQVQYGSNPGGYNSYNQNQNQNQSHNQNQNQNQSQDQQGAPRMVQQGLVQNQGQRSLKQYGQGRGQGQGQGYQNQNQGQQGQQYQGQGTNYQQTNGGICYQNQPQPYLRQQQPQQIAIQSRYNPHGAQGDSNQYGQQAMYDNVNSGQNYIPSVTGGVVQQGACYDNYGNIYSTPGVRGGGVSGAIDGVAAQMGHMTVTQGQGQNHVTGQSQGQGQGQQRIQQYNPERPTDSTVSYVTVVPAGTPEGTVRPMIVQGGQYAHQGYMTTPSMVPVSSYDQSVQPNASTTQVMYENTVYGQGHGHVQESQSQNQSYGGRGYSTGGRGGGGRGTAGRALNVDARPFNIYQGQGQGGHVQGQGQGSDYNNGGVNQNQNHGHGQQMSYEQQGVSMENQNGYNSENYTYSQQQTFVPCSTSNGTSTGSNGQKNQKVGRNESFPACQGVVSVEGGGGGEASGGDNVGVAESDSSNGNSNGNSNSNQVAVSGASTSS